jgi:hypothetical protein
MFRVSIVLAALALAGCASTPATPTKPTASMIKTAQQDIKNVLRDPASAQFGRDFRSYTIANGETAICGTVNARNGFGGFTGSQPVMVNYRQGRAPLVFIEGPAGYECTNLAQGRSARF